MNVTTSFGPFSVAFRFFGVVPRTNGDLLDTLHMGLCTFEAGKGGNVTFRRKLTARR